MLISNGYFTDILPPRGPGSERIRKAMKNPTRERLLQSACVVFAEKGYDHATIADICDRADANIAAVNYYFGDKESLYDEVWRHAFAVTKAAFSLDPGLPPAAAPRDRLRAFVGAMLHRILSVGTVSYFPRLMAKEMAEPTPSHAAILEEAVTPQRARMEGIVRELLGPEAEEDHIRLSCFSLVSQCLFLNFTTSIRRHLFDASDAGDQGVDVLADHITAFTMAGIERYRRDHDEGAA